MKIKEAPAHGEIGHFCHGGCTGYAKGGRVPEQLMDAIARNREEIGLPATEGGVGRLVDLIPGIGLAKQLGEASDIKDRMADPGYLHNTAGRALDTNFTHGGPSDKFGQAADVQMLSKGGKVEDFGEGPTVGNEENGEKDPSEIPEDIREYVEQAHKAIKESRPDENWRIKAAERPESVAPYKRDEEEDHGEGDSTSGIPHFDEGGVSPGSDFSVDPGASDTVKMNGVGGEPPPAPIQPPNTAPIAPATPPVAPAAPAPPPAGGIVPSGTMPALTDQTFMDRANKMLGLNPQEQAGFMKLLGSNAQKGQIGAGIAGIGDAIASGGTLGKVNPGALSKSEDLIQDRTKEGIEGMQTIRGNQEKAAEMADKLEARDPKSPLSKWAQKAYAGVGKKIGLDLTNASAALIGDVTGKGVEALNTEYQGQLKQMGLQLQKSQIDATIANQKAEREAAKATNVQGAAKALADKGAIKSLVDMIPGTAGHAANKVLEKQAEAGNYAPAEGPVKVNSMEEYKALPSGTHYVDSYGTEKVKK